MDAVILLALIVPSIICIFSLLVWVRLEVGDEFECGDFIIPSVLVKRRATSR